MFAEPAELADKGKGALSRVYRAAALLDGVFKELSLHVGGVVFSSQAIDRVLPLTLSPEGFPQLAWDKDTVERLRIFKLDLLGVRGFEVIAPLALKGDVDGNDAAVWQQIQQARTVGCFQLESPLSRENLLKARPANLSGTGHRRSHHPPRAGPLGHETGLPGTSSRPAIRCWGSFSPPAAAP